MATETGVHKQEFLIKDLQTRSVTLYPSRANVIRDINDVSLNPGRNEVTIYGLTPTADEHSVKVDGKGAATIIDMTVDLVPNRDIFEDTYPDIDDSDVSSSESDPDDEETQEEELKSVNAELKKLEEKVKDERETFNSANNRLSTLETFAKTVDSKSMSNQAFQEHLRTYESERKNLYKIHKNCTAALAELDKQTNQKKKEQEKLGKADRKAKEKARKEKDKLLLKKMRQRAEKREEKRRLKEERLSFWAKKVYRVILHLDNSTNLTPDESRRGSTELQKLVSPASGKNRASPNPQTVSLSLSYITHAASWSPRYDLDLKTPSCSGSIIYRAEFRNTTSETWKDAKVVLSTSQTSYQGLNDTVPHMSPWHVSLAKTNAKRGNASLDYGGGLYSKAEKGELGVKNATSAQQKYNRGDLFGNNAPAIEQRKKQISGSSLFGSSGMGNNRETAQAAPPPPPQQQRAQQQVAMLQQRAQQQAAMQQATGYGSRQGQMQSWQDPNISSHSHGGHGFGGGAEYSSTADEHIDFSDEEQTLDIDATAPIAFQESSREDYGMTTTYDIPGVRTLSPSSLSRRHRIIEIPLSSIHLYHILVPKLRPAAFLKARLKNSSNVTLLSGQAGLTLDGSFLGNSTLPRCSPGETFNLPLGVDPAVHVSYAKPTVRRSSSGVFNKEDCAVYTRTCWLTNTKPDAQIDLLVLDQVPVSEDERLRIGIVQPKGLRTEGDAVRAGTSIKPGSNNDGDSSRQASVYGSDGVKGMLGKEEKWGKAVATLKKAGEVAWDVKLNKGAACRLVLEYEARIPGSESIVGI
ncbi:MAG: hypothetical protein M1812_003387 [Candelaria pacifica]|nr:MAG: hypothetical protein M1812_003387 [Candelaria pacifica]